MERVVLSIPLAKIRIPVHDRIAWHKQ